MIKTVNIGTMCDYELRGFYVYVHRRLTDNKIFYVGKGKLKRHVSKTRGKFWYKVANKYGVYSEVILDNLAESDALSLEVELIKFYGRRDTGEGYLVNVTDGGEGIAGYVYTAAQREKVSRRVSGINHPLFDSTIYTFINAYTNAVMESTKYDFNKTIGSEVAGLFGKTHLHIRGWYLKNSLTDYDIEAIRCGYSGKYCVHTDHRIYEFYNLTTDQLLQTTRLEFKALSGIDPSSLISGSNNVRGDWVMHSSYLELGSKFLLNQTKGLNNGRAEATVYTFFNMVTKETVVSTRFDMEEMLGKKISSLFNKAGVLTLHNWCLIENKDKMGNSLKDFTVYVFTHDSGVEFIGTRIQFKKSTSVSTKNMFKTKTKRAKGWTFRKKE